MIFKSYTVIWRIILSLCLLSTSSLQAVKVFLAIIRLSCASQIYFMSTVPAIVICRSLNLQNHFLPLIILVQYLTSFVIHHCNADQVIKRRWLWRCRYKYATLEQLNSKSYEQFFTKYSLNSDVQSVAIQSYTVWRRRHFAYSIFSACRQTV